MENTENTPESTSTPNPKKNYGGMLLTIAIVVALLFFGGRYTYKLIVGVPVADTTVVDKAPVDSLASDSIVLIKDTVKLKVDTTKKAVVDTTKKK